MTIPNFSVLTASEFLNLSEKQVGFKGTLHAVEKETERTA